MNAKEHPDYQEENIHLQETIGWIQEEEKFLQDYDEILKSEIADIRKTVITLMDERLVAKLQLHQIAEKDMGQLKKAKENPYFGRIDFQERRREDMDSIYIGKHGFMDKDRDIPVVVDWRAPIADVYYSGHSKEVSYRAPYGEVSGTMHLKRRYEIENGVLQNIYEEKTSETIIEESLQGKGAFLVEALNKSTQGRLKEIVATIQDQQNRIIRSEMSKPLVVQGVAGSGKTTIALHRMAYLIYNNRRNIEEAKYLVIAPNKLFLHYISEILPDLGVENVIQTTFEDWAMEQIGIPISTEGWVDPLNSFIQGAGEEWEQIKLIGRIKGSLLFKKVLDNSLQQWQESLLPKEDLTFEDIQLISYKNLQDIFLTSNVHLSLNERIERLGLYLKNRLKDNMTEFQQKIGDFYQRKIEDLKREAESLEEIRQNIIALYDERDRRLSTIKEELGGAVDRYVRQVQRIQPLDFYRRIFEIRNEMERAFGKRVGEAEIINICERVEENLKLGKIEREDLGPLAYLHMKLCGFEEKNKYAHIVVDEAQDFDEFKISILREMSMNDSFTFVGDLSQGIYSYRGIVDWKKTMERVFPQKEYQYHVLTTSYRSTIEIINLANEVIKKCSGLEVVLAEPILRHGHKPRLVKCDGEEAMFEELKKDIELLEKEGFYSRAILCKDLKTTEKVFERLNMDMENIHLITDRVIDYQGGTVVIPAYLSKGLEFDGVLLWNGNKESFTMDPIDVKLLYISLTRALHRLSIYYTGELSAILENMEACRAL